MNIVTHSLSILRGRFIAKNRYYTYILIVNFKLIQKRGPNEVHNTRTKKNQIVIDTRTVDQRVKAYVDNTVSLTADFRVIRYIYKSTEKSFEAASLKRTSMQAERCNGL